MWGGRSGAIIGRAVGVGQGVAAPLFPPPPEVLWPLGHRGLRVQSAEIKYPRHPRCGRAAVRHAAESVCRGLLLAVGVRCAHIVFLFPCPPRRSAPAPPSFAPLSARGLGVRPRWGGVYAPPSSLATFGSGGSLLAPLLPAQGHARPWANVALPPSLLSARGGDGAGLCVCLIVPLWFPRPCVVCIRGLSLAKRKGLGDRLATRVCGLPRP